MKRVAKLLFYCRFFTACLLSVPMAASQSRLPIPEVPPLYPYDPLMAGRPQAGKNYKIVFDLNSPANDDNNPNPGLVLIARLLNTYAQFKISRDHREFLVVLRGDFVTLAEDDPTYRQQHNAQPNPNAVLMQRLVKAGVVLIADSTSLTKKSLSKANLQDGVQIHVAANLTFLDLEAQGFVYTTTKSLE